MIYINDIPSFRDPESCEWSIDDRVQKIEIINGVAIQDYGHITVGDVISLVCMFTEENFRRVLDLWEAREKVSFTDTSGLVWQNMRIVLQKMRRDENFPNYVLATFELWRK